MKSIQLFFEHVLILVTQRMNYGVYIEGNLGITASTNNIIHWIYWF